MMTARELAGYVGSERTIRIEDGRLTIPVRVVDAKDTYGVVRVLVEPVMGAGQAWIEARRLYREEGEPTHACK